ncbi:uncharacterized protein LOC123544252 isoform X2 [Mercenaria mercenaria]|uniref:uncharacterized protein LOC123544252 isoform X2 n=1 Tax=Mercenaria mercenaria TaxID=6596 RepID=UPI00234EEEE4|nr:uncharacterized protein LOC123544252 isoform X2 [Mercenaria mercenaria]
MMAFVLVVFWLTTETTLVCGLNFTLSKTRVILGTTGKLFMTCDVTEKDASVVYDLQIRRETSTNWETLAFIEAGVTEDPALNKRIVNDKDFVVGGILDKENPLNTHLTLQMNIEKMIYDDARVYICEMTYKSHHSGSTFSIKRNATLFIFVSGLNFTLSKTRVIVGTTGKLLMTCQVTETDVDVFYNIQIRRETNSGWQTIALIEAGVTEVPALHKDIDNDRDFVVGGILDKENPLNTYLTLQMNIEKMTYGDARVYRCEMTYKSNISGSAFSETRNATLLIEAPGLNFTFSKTRVIVGTTGKLLLTCQVTETDVEFLYSIQIRRETNSGWQTIANIEADGVPALHKDICNDRDFVVGGILDKENPLNTYLTLQMNTEKMTYHDARVYRCEMTYKSNISGSDFSETRNATLIIVDTLQDSECVRQTNSVIVSVILGVAIILITIYASYITVIMRRMRGRNRHCERCEMLNAAPVNDTSEIQNSSDEV